MPSSTRCVTAVSYTHLDVYKRQTTTSKTINIIIHGFDKNPTTILLNNKILNNNQYKFENNLIYISLQCELDKNQKIEIKL